MLAPSDEETELRPERERDMEKGLCLAPSV
jgi:hypothetical protein